MSERGLGEFKQGGQRSIKCDFGARVQREQRVGWTDSPTFCPLSYPLQRPSCRPRQLSFLPRRSS